VDKVNVVKAGITDETNDEVDDQAETKARYQEKPREEM